MGGDDRVLPTWVLGDRFEGDAANDDLYDVCTLGVDGGCFCHGEKLGCVLHEEACRKMLGGSNSIDGTGGSNAMNDRGMQEAIHRIAVALNGFESKFLNMDEVPDLEEYFRRMSLLENELQGWLEYLDRLAVVADNHYNREEYED
jgi:hypothetical protein